MNRRSGTSRGATKKPVVVLAGEDSNDRACLRIILETFCPEMRGRIVEISDSVRLRQATGKNLTSRVAVLERKARARAARENASVACVFIHEDFDASDSDEYLEVRKRVQNVLDERFGTAHYVLAVWELEAWLLLFPDALAQVVAGWRVPSRYRGTDTGRLSDPKKILMGQMSRSARKYRESDAPGVVEKAISLSHHERPVGSNRSWNQYNGDAKHCCRGHLSRRVTD